jgi:endonuclease/exonuclease/phosphatase family metal-dependent hydrolase
MLVSPGKGLAFQRRTTTDGTSASTAGGSGLAPTYVKLTRSGNVFTAYKSSDGTTWTQVASATISMGSTIYVGLAVSSHVDGTVASATFTETAVTLETDSGSASGSGGGGVGGTPPPGSGEGVPLRVLHWNTHHGGFGTDGVYDTDRLATWIARENPDVVSLNELEKKTSWGNEDQPAKYKALLEAKTGHPWYMVWAQEYGDWDANGKGNVIYSRFPWVSTKQYLLTHTRTVALGQIVVNGRNITFSSTHLDPDSESYRVDQAEELVPWETNYAENRIVAGDMNAQPTSTSMTYVKNTYIDGWLAAKADGFAFSAADNPNGYTRNSRIDYVFTSKNAANLTMTRFEVIDVRDAKGVMPSDHRPLVVDYLVK